MEWQIRERGSNRLIRQFEASEFFIDKDGELWSKISAELYDCEASNIYLTDHYICCKGEILVNEQEYDALKAELAELKAQKEKLVNAFNDLLNDCINFDNGSLTDSVLKEASSVLKEFDSPNVQLGYFGEPEKEVEQERILRAAKIAEKVCMLNIEKFQMLHGKKPIDVERLFGIEIELATIINQGV